MKDLVDELDAVHRQVGAGRAAPDGRSVLLRRTYHAEIEDVWDAITSRERIGRWFLPVSGDLRLGGRFQLEGNAGGEIVACYPPRLLRVTWVVGEHTAGGDPGASEVEARLSSGTRGETVLELEHTAPLDPAMWDRYGPGAVGVGWDLTLLGLGRHLAGGSITDQERAAWGTSDEARRFMTASSDRWGAAHAAAGAAPEAVAAATANTTAFYVPG